MLFKQQKVWDLADLGNVLIDKVLVCVRQTQKECLRWHAPQPRLRAVAGCRPPACMRLSACRCTIAQAGRLALQPATQASGGRAWGTPLGTDRPQRHACPHQRAGAPHRRGSLPPACAAGCWGSVFGSTASGAWPANKGGSGQGGVGAGSVATKTPLGSQNMLH